MLIRRNTVEKKLSYQGHKGNLFSYFPSFLSLPSLLISYPDPMVELECTHGRVNSGYETISLLPLHRFCKREDLQKRPIMQC